MNKEQLLRGVSLLMNSYTELVVDYGHGRETPGKYYEFADHDGLVCREWITNRMTAARVIEQMVNSGRRVYDVVADRYWTEADVNAPDWGWMKLESSDPPLSARYRRANEHRHGLGISFHSNAVGYSNKGPSLSARGGCIYTSPGNTDSDVIAEWMYIEFVWAFAKESVFIQKGDLSDGDHDREARFAMLTKTAGTWVLPEMLFFVNIEDARFLLSDHGQRVISGAYVDALLPFVEKA